MPDKQQLMHAVLQWINSWNQRDIEQVMMHYADDVIFYSPTVTKRWNIAEGQLTGKALVEQHFRKGIAEMPTCILNFIPFYMQSTVLSWCIKGKPAGWRQIMWYLMKPAK